MICSVIALAGEWCVECYNITLGGDFVECRPTIAAFGALTGRVADHDFHVKAACPALDDRADMTDADNAYLILAHGSVYQLHY